MKTNINKEVSLVQNNTPSAQQSQNGANYSSVGFHQLSMDELMARFAGKSDEPHMRHIITSKKQNTMEKNFSPAAKANNSTLAATEKKLTESFVNEFIGNRTFVDLTKATSTSGWDGQALEEDRIYHLDKMGGLPILWIKDNRRTWKRAMKMFTACRDNTMTTPAIVTDAKVVAEWGLILIDPCTREEVPADNLDGKYCILEGHGRSHGFLIALADSAQTGGKPFDFHFVYKHFDSPENFGQAYVSTNADMTRTTSKDRLAIAGARCNDPIVISYLGKIKNDLVISKGSYFWTFGREATVVEVSKLIYGEADAPKFDKDITDALALCYESFKEKFGAEGAEKIYRGVSAAQWCADRIGKADDKSATALVICDKVKAMTNEIYTAIITAKSNSKKHITRDQVVKNQLDKMMK